MKNFTPTAAESSFLGMDDVLVVQKILDRMADAQKRAVDLKRSLQAAYDFIVGNLCGQEIFLMLRNKWGLSKKDAKKLYYDLHGKKDGDEEDGRHDEAKPPESIEGKISMIMDYMKETSAKLDSIDRDIADLKKQVEEILKRI